MGIIWKGSDILRDLTQGKPSRVILAFATPLIISNLFQQLYNMADSLIVGNFSGKDSLAAVGAATPFTMLFVMMGTGLSVGCSVVVAQLFGAKDFRKMKTSVYTALISFLFIGVLITVIGLLISKPALRLLNTPDNIMDETIAYLDIYIYGLPFLFLYNACNAIFNALGDSKKPLVFLIFSSVVNVGLDIWFVGPLQMGVAGAAWATLIAQGLACILSFSVLIIKIRNVKCEGKAQLFNIHTLKEIYRIGVPTMLQSCSVSVGQLLVQSLVNGYGADVIAGYASATKINQFGNVVIIALGSALSTFSAQNIGARKLDRPAKGVRAVLVIEMIYFAVLCTVVFLFGRQLIAIFASSTATEEMLTAGTQFFTIVIPGYVFFAFMNAYKSVSQGAGFMRGFLMSTVLDILVRVGCSFALSPFIGFYAICIAYPAGWLVGAVVAAVYYFKGSWKKGIRLAENPGGSGESAGQPEDDLSVSEAGGEMTDINAQPVYERAAEKSAK